MSTPAAPFATAAALITTSSKNLAWRGDLDPRGLPNTDRFTASQRAILGACVELFGEVGYAATTVRDIASLVGIKSASLYKSFQSKQAMLDALSELGHAEFSRRQLAAVMGASDPRGQLAAAMRSLVLMTCEFPRLTRIVNSEVRNLSRGAFDRDQAARLQSARILREVLDRGRREGVFGNPDDDAITVVFWSLGVALAAWYPYAYDVSAEDVATSYVDVSLRIVGAPLEGPAATPVAAKQRESGRRRG